MTVFLFEGKITAESSKIARAVWADCWGTLTALAFMAVSFWLLTSSLWSLEMCFRSLPRKSASGAVGI